MLFGTYVLPYSDGKGDSFDLLLHLLFKIVLSLKIGIKMFRREVSSTAGLYEVEAAGNPLCT